jgi:hypothetical protein
MAALSSSWVARSAFSGVAEHRLLNAMVLGHDNGGDPLIRKKYPIHRCMWGFEKRDLYRVKFEANNLEPFACLAFPQTT